MDLNGDLSVQAFFLNLFFFRLLFYLITVWPKYLQCKIFLPNFIFYHVLYFPPTYHYFFSLFWLYSYHGYNPILLLNVRLWLELPKKEIYIKYDNTD